MYLGNMALMNPYMTVARDLSRRHGLSAGSELAWRAVAASATEGAYDEDDAPDVQAAAARGKRKWPKWEMEAWKLSKCNLLAQNAVKQRCGSKWGGTVVWVEVKGGRCVYQIQWNNGEEQPSPVRDPLRPFPW